MSKTKITLLYADEEGEIFDAPGVSAAGRSGNQNIPLRREDLIPLPESADLMYLPDRMPVGEKDGELLPVSGQAVAALLPAGYTRIYMPAFQKTEAAQTLPLYGYTAVALYKDEMYAAAIYTDENSKWDPARYNTDNLPELINKVKRDVPGNRLVEHLANCSLQWHCCTAQNLFYGRWEAGIPVSPVCNADCLGCISLQAAECCPSPQSRIDFSPSPDEIAQIGSYHLSRAADAIVSFGQGCEGEPSLAADNIVPALKMIRARTDKGQININTNAGFTDGIARLADAGLNSMRVSIISAVSENYKAYYRCNYELEDVIDSIRYAKKKNVYVSLNMLYFPGFNDSKTEAAAWRKFLRSVSVDMIQVRNLNIDPDLFAQIMPEFSPALGTKMFFGGLKGEFSAVSIGSFSHYQNK
ncbi:radical SAM protein [Pectinatus haikarae]|uniref:radical SAM protein n=1 Tax=Pectinatus haikarae TaxID=349096 RepID=UPI0018C8442B|nr:radical SAM protein [Pectinatus haikarae]